MLSLQIKKGWISIHFQHISSLYLISSLLSFVTLLLWTILFLILWK